MLKLLLFCLLLVVCWPLALLALILYPFVWLLTIPFRLAGVAVGARQRSGGRAGRVPAGDQRGRTDQRDHPGRVAQSVRGRGPGGSEPRPGCDPTPPAALLCPGTVPGRLASPLSRVGLPPQLAGRVP